MSATHPTHPTQPAVGALPTPTFRAVIARDGARRALAALDEHDSIAVLTFGQFSIGDAMRALLDRTGPADITISTWTAAKAEIEEAYRLVTDGRIRSMRWLVDRSFVTRQPAYCRALMERFGPESIRTTRTHAKFVILRGESIVYTIHTSANLNANPRLESLQVISGTDHADWLTGIVDQLWAQLPPGDMNGELPEALPTSDSAGLRVGSTPAVGRRFLLPEHVEP